MKRLPAACRPFWRLRDDRRARVAASLAIGPLFSLALSSAAAPARAEINQPPTCWYIPDAAALATCNAAIQKSARTGPASAELLDGRGRYETTAGELAAAVADFGAALKANPSDSEAYVDRATVYALERRRDLAVADLLKALALNPSDNEAKVELANVASTPAEVGAPSQGSLTRRASADPASVYPEIKALFTSSDRPAQWQPGEHVQLDFECTTGADYLGEAAPLDPDDRTDPVFVYDANLAFRVVRWEADLAAAGYPSSVSTPLIAAFESNQLSEIAIQVKPKPGPNPAGERDPFLNRMREEARSMEAQLKGALDGYQAAHSASSLPGVDAAGGCGGGGGNRAIAVTTEPAGATVFFIPVFFYKLCQAEGIDPNNPSQCDRWREMLAGVLTQVAGDYDYLARWADGVTRRGTLSVSNIETASIVLTRP